MDIPTFIPPLAVLTTSEGLSITRRIPKYYATPAMQQRFPNQVWFDHKVEQYLSYYSERTTEVLNTAGMLSPNPLVIGGGLSTYSLVDGERSKEQMIELGVPSTRIRVTGHPDHDVLYRNFKAKNEPKNGRKIKRKMIQASKNLQKVL